MWEETMTSTIALPRHSAVLVLGKAKDNGFMAKVADAIPAIASPWDVNKPEASLEALYEALDAGQPVRVCMLRSHRTARRQVVNAATKRGAIPIALRLPGAEEIGDEEGFAMVVEVCADTRLSYTISPMPCDLHHLHGPFDIVGDIHGCHDELCELLDRLGYINADTGKPQPHPEGRTLVFLGDLTDRGPANRAVLQLVKDLERFGALRVLGNHDEKLARWLIGKKVSISPAMQTSVDELEVLSEDARTAMGEWLGGAEPHLVLDEGKLIVAHAGLEEAQQGRRSRGARSMALYGKVTGGVDAYGHPEAEDFALDYHGAALVVHGHVVHANPREVNNVIAIDTGCVFGGSLTALRYPERDFVSVAAKGRYCEREQF